MIQGSCIWELDSSPMMNILRLATKRAFAGRKKVMHNKHDQFYVRLRLSSSNKQYIGISWSTSPCSKVDRFSPSVTSFYARYKYARFAFVHSHPREFDGSNYEVYALYACSSQWEDSESSHPIHSPPVRNPTLGSALGDEFRNLLSKAQSHPDVTEGKSPVALLLY